MFKSRNKWCFVIPFFLLIQTSLKSQCDVCTDCETSTETIIANTYATAFDDGSGLSFGSDLEMGLLTGANDAFGGSIWNVDPSVSANGVADLCLTGDFVVTAEDPSVYPITVEFRIENGDCGFFPCPWIDFNTVVTGDGPISLGGALTSGNIGGNGPFDPAGTNPSLVAAIANFSGTPMPAGVTISYSNFVLASVSCEAIPGCIDGGGTSQCLTCDECENLIETPIANSFTNGFDGGSGNSFGDEFAMGLLTGANDDFGGSLWSVNPAVANSSINNLCLTGDFNVTAESSAVYPITVEFRIENSNCGFFPCPWIDFNTSVFADGSISIGGILSSGNIGGNGIFDPAGQDPSIVAAIANFSGTPMPAGGNHNLLQLCVARSGLPSNSRLWRYCRLCWCSWWYRYSWFSL